MTKKKKINAPAAPNQDTLCLQLRGLEALLRVGILAKERQRKQRLLLDADIWVKTKKSYAKTKSLNDLVDYAGLYRLFTQVWPKRPQVDFLETLAEEALQFLFADPRVVAARITLKKPDLLPAAASVGISLYRQRRDKKSKAHFSTEE